MSDKAAIAFSGGKTVPVIKDEDTVVRDSWKIAEHLESRYPDAPPLFGGEIGRGVTAAFNTWVDRAAGARHAAGDRRRHPRARRPARRGLFPPDDGEGPEAPRWKRRARGATPRSAGSAGCSSRCRRRSSARRSCPARTPAYADYILFSVFQWARVMSPQELLAPEDPLCQWRERMLELFDGFARNVPTHEKSCFLP